MTWPFGAGVAMGYATLGTIGFAERFDMAPAAWCPTSRRQSQEARADLVLLTQRVATAVQEVAQVEPVAELSVADSIRPAPTFNILGLKEPEKASEPAGARPLSPREHEVALLVAGGRTNRQMAEELVVSEATASKHIENILSKLGFSSRAEIASWSSSIGCWLWAPTECGARRRCEVRPRSGPAAT
jgi:DNA-binding CsgD family transcriptional regulator